MAGWITLAEEVYKMFGALGLALVGIVLAYVGTKRRMKRENTATMRDFFKRCGISYSGGSVSVPDPVALHNALQNDPFVIGVVSRFAEAPPPPPDFNAP
jgi:hypothetical protein